MFPPRHLARGILASLLLCTVLAAQDTEPSPEPPPQQIWERHAQQPPSWNILFLIDSSGSMRGRKINDAINFAMQVAGAPVDEFNITLVSFGSNVSRWPGTEDVDDQTGNPVGHRGWSAMPSAVNLEAARGWISNNLDGRSTYVVPGLLHSVRTSSGVSDTTLQNLDLPVVSLRELTVVIITDGEFTERLSAVIETVKAMQTLRQEQELPPVNFGLIGIDVDTEGSDEKPSTNARMRQLSESFGLGYLRLAYIDESSD